MATLILMVFLIGAILFFSNKNEFHSIEIKYLENVGQKIDQFYQKNSRLPRNLQEVAIDESYPYPPNKLFNIIEFKVAGDYRLIYHPIDEKNFTLVMTNNKGYIVYFYSDDQDVFQESEGRSFTPARFLYNYEPYKSEQFLKGRPRAPFNQASSWPDI